MRDGRMPLITINQSCQFIKKLNFNKQKMKLQYIKFITPYFLIPVMTLFMSCSGIDNKAAKETKPRVIVTSDGEIDDECSMVRFLLYANEFDIEGIVTSSSQYHWHGHRWAGDDWVDPYLDAYSKVYPNLVQHNKNYPAPDYLRSVTFLGNIEAEGEMDLITPGSQHITKVLLDRTNDNPIWIQAWGGPNTIARALKTIEENHPDQMEYVAKKIRLFFIWEQDSTYQSYIRPHWGKYNIPTIITDQFWAIAYQWNKVLPEEKQAYFNGDWMKSNILGSHGSLCSLYKAHTVDSHGLSGDTDFNEGDFRSEGDSPAFLHNIPTGLRNMESPDFGGWGGRYVLVRENTWLDPVPFDNYQYPEDRWYTGSAWGRQYMKNVYPENPDQMHAYFKPLVRWTDAIQNDFAARADWCVHAFQEANHPPEVKLQNPEDLNASPGEQVKLSAKGTTDPDGDDLAFQWWQYWEADTYKGEVKMENFQRSEISFSIPKDVNKGETIHIVCEVRDNGEPNLTRYRRVVITID